MWAKGYITKESHDSTKLTKGGGIIKLKSKEGRFTKTTNFSKDQWGELSDIHMRDALVLGPDKLQVLEGEIQAAVANTLCQRKKSKVGRPETNRSDGKVQGLGYQDRIALSDSDF